MGTRRPPRSSSRRNTPVSPPKQPTARPPSEALQEGPRRSTRSQSRELGHGEAVIPTRNGRGRNARQASVESTGSQESRTVASRRRPGKEARQIADPGLSVVVEDPTVEYPTLPGDVGSSDRDQLDDEERELGNALLSKSPGGVSAISGTTALTSHSQRETEDMDPDLMVDALPHLFLASTTLLDFLAQKNLSASDVAKLFESLQVPKFSQGKRLRRFKDTFETQRVLFGNDFYIEPGIVLRGLFNVRLVDDIGKGPWRPDWILQKANLARLALEIIPAQSKSPAALKYLNQLDNVFPTPFVTSFVEEGAQSRVGSSELLQDTFLLALELRTQFLIILLAREENEANFDPNTILLSVFYLEDQQVFRGWDIDGLQDEEARLPQEYEAMVIERVKDIRQYFVGGLKDPVDFNGLESAFPWSEFIAAVARWCRLRANEIDEQLMELGGSGNVILELEKEVEHRRRHEMETSQHSHPDVDPEVRRSNKKASTSNQHQAEDRPALLPAVHIVKRSETSSNKTLNSPGGLIRLKQIEAKLRRQDGGKSFVPQTAKVASGVRDSQATTAVSSGRPSDNSDRPVAAPPSGQPARQEGSDNRLFIEQEGGSDHGAQMNDGDDGEYLPPSGQNPSPQRDVPPPTIQEIMAMQRNYDKESASKANPAKWKGRIYDRQEGAHRVQWDSQSSSQSNQANSNGKRKGKRPLSSLENEEDIVMNDGGEEDEEGGFELDRRSHNLSQRRKEKPRIAPASAHAGQSHPSPPKRTRVERDNASTDTDAMDAAAQRQLHEEVREQNARQRNREPTLTSSQPPPSTSRSEHEQVNERARALVARHMSINPPQERRAWSSEETSRLIFLIENHGKSYTRLKKEDEAHKDGPLLTRRTQVNLKDKARNVKMDYLKARAELPENFDSIPLKTSEIAKLWELGIEYKPPSTSETNGS